MSRREANQSLYIRNLSDESTPEDVRELFEKYGRVRDVYIPQDYYTRVSRGFGYVEFYDIRDAEDALHDMQGERLHGREIEMEYAAGDRKTPYQMRGKVNGGMGRYGGGGSRRYDDDRRRSRSRSPRRRRSRSRSRDRSRRSRSRSSRRRSSKSHRSRSRSRDSKSKRKVEERRRSPSSSGDERPEKKKREEPDVDNDKAASSDDDDRRETNGAGDIKPVDDERDASDNESDGDK